MACDVLRCTEHSIMSQRKRLGECLVEASVISEEQLKEALSVQKKTNKRLGQILIELRWATEEEICQAVSKVLRVDYMNISSALVSREVVQLVSETLAMEQNILPLFIQNNILYLAMENPLDINTIQHVEFKIGMQVKPVMVLSSQLQKVIRKHYDVEEYVGSMLENMSEEESVSVEQEPMMDVMEGTTDLRDLREISEGSQTVKLVNMIIADGIKKRATDIHIEPSLKSVTVRYRVDGILTGAIPILKWLQLPLISRIKVISGMDIAEHRKPQDGRIKITYAARRVDLRVSTLPSNFGEKVVIRILDKETSGHDPTRLGMSQNHLDAFLAILKQPQGWILVTGPTGSGKTTTLYASLNAVMDATKSIVTVEDPIEYQLEGINQVQVNPKAGLTFASGLRSILRQDPDIILVGEIRDAETASIAMQAAETGHLVLSTLHTNDAVSTVNRLLNLGVTSDLVASNLLVVVAQRLVRKICSQCKTEYVPDAQELRRIGMHAKQAQTSVFYKGTGCEACTNTGYTGRIGIYEIFAPNDRLRDEIAKRPAKHTLKHLAIGAGMKTMLQDGIEKVFQGITTIEEIARVCTVEQDTLESRIQVPEDKQAIVTPEEPQSRQAERPDTCEQCGTKLGKDWLMCPVCGKQRLKTPEMITSQVVQEQQITTQADIPEKEGRILIAEDDAATRKIVQSLLKHQGYQVIAAVDGEDALKKIPIEQPDVVILDIDMPKRDGFSVCKAMRADVKTMFVPVIMLTARDSIEEKIQGLSIGADDYITKPFHPAELLARIEVALRRSFQQEVAKTDEEHNG